MNRQERSLAYQAIDENVSDSTARKIIKWVMECELNGFDTIRPTNQYLANKFGWGDQTVREAIYKAKRSGFIATTGTNKNRTFELNVQFLKGKMAEIIAKKPPKKNLDFGDVMRGLPDNLPDKITDNLPDTLPDKLPDKLAQNNRGHSASNSNSNSNSKRKGETDSPNGSSVPSPFFVDVSKQKTEFSEDTQTRKKEFALCKELLSLMRLHDVKAGVKLRSTIRARLREGYSELDLRAIARWSATQEDDFYKTPHTLFSEAGIAGAMVKMKEKKKANTMRTIS